MLSVASAIIEEAARIASPRRDRRLKDFTFS
jgi:hypothetical protein